MFYFIKGRYFVKVVRGFICVFGVGVFFVFRLWFFVFGVFVSGCGVLSVFLLGFVRVGYRVLVLGILFLLLFIDCLIEREICMSRFCRREGCIESVGEY